MPAKRKKLSQIDYKTFVGKKAITVEDLIEMVKSGEIKMNEWVFPLAQMVEISEYVAYGSYRNCLMTVDLDTKSRKENAHNQVKKIISDAFIINK